MRKTVLFFLIAFALTACERHSPSSGESSGKTIEATQKAEAKKPATSKRSQTNLALKNGVPDFGGINDIKLKKKAFFEYFLPIIYQENSKLFEEQRLVKKWKKQNGELNKKETAAFAKLLTRYQVKTDDPEKIAEQLTRRIQLLPPSLVLAQAANESAWGTSRFALEGNNYFGQWCFTIGCGLIPGERNHRSKHEVRVFSSPQESVSSYMRNLNTHPQYQDLRTIRLQELEQRGYARGLALAEGLIGYSERREAYVEEIQQMIRFNKLDQLDPNPQGIVQGSN